MAAAGGIPIPNLSLSDHSAASGYSTAGGTLTGPYTVVFGNQSTPGGISSYLPFLLIAGLGFYLWKHKGR